MNPDRLVRDGWQLALIPAMDRQGLADAQKKGEPFVCQICQEAIKVGDYVFLQPNKSGDRYIHEHFTCVERIRNQEAAETEALLKNPWLVEAAAKAVGLTITQFQELPRYIREMKLRSSANSVMNKPHSD